MGAEPSDRLMRCDEVETRITLSRSTIYRKMRKKSFPEPLRIESAPYAGVSLRSRPGWQPFPGLKATRHPEEACSAVA